MPIEEIRNILISTGGSIPVNKGLIQILGLDATILYGELINRYYYFKQKDKLEDGYFYNTVSSLEMDTSLTKYKQKNAIQILVKSGLIKVKFSSNQIGKKIRYFTIIEDANKLESLIKTGKLMMENSKRGYKG